MIAPAAFLNEALDRPEAPRRRRVLDGWAMAVGVADGTVVVGLVLIALVKMVVGLGGWAVGLVVPVGVCR